jgi:hypothetical protein
MSDPGAHFLPLLREVAGSLHSPVVRRGPEQHRPAANLRGIGESGIFHKRDNVGRRIVLQVSVRKQETPEKSLLAVFRAFEIRHVKLAAGL